jgi:3-deoxy-manno-octulosonate cytidylyltransferase (CMP-KDO synthetase)
MKDFIVVIPARIQSTRLPRKPLVEILGKTLIERTYNQCIKVVAPELVFVATDSEEIRGHCKKKGIKVLMTSEKALTGTDRVYEASKQVPAKYYINVQGDEPVINPNDITRIIENIDFEGNSILNGYTEIDDRDSYLSTSIPKVVFRPDGKLLYMSRAPIPGNKIGDFTRAWRQVCIYAFPANALKVFNAVSKTPLEELEDIEILRFLELNFEVDMVHLSNHSIPVDLPEDIRKVEDFIRKHGE